MLEMVTTDTDIWILMYICVWNVDTGECIYIDKGHNDGVCDDDQVVAFNYDGTKMYLDRY